MAMESAKVVAASAVAACPVASASSDVALADIVASFARFSNVVMTILLCTCLATFACMACSCLADSTSVVARSLSASLLALRFRC